MTTVVVFGGGGFLGRRLVDRLTAESVSVRIAMRHPDPARIELRALGSDLVTFAWFPTGSARAQDSTKDSFGTGSKMRAVSIESSFRGCAPW